MGRFSVVGLSSFAFILGLSGTGPAWADHWCKEIDDPTTISTDKSCVRVTEEVNGDIVNNATLGQAHHDRPGFFIGSGGLLTGKLINNGTITGGGDDWAAL